MLDMPTKFVAMFKHSNTACDVADEVERLFGFGSCSVQLASYPTGGGSTLYIDTRFPTWKKAYDYARELADALRESPEAYQATKRR